MTFRLFLYRAVIICILALCKAADDYATISLGQGQQLRGWKTMKASGDVVYKFYGIPYAQPPIGQRRFQPPEPASDWSGLKDALTKSAICPQLNDEDTTSVRAEDCLYLNVFSPDFNSSLPVLVWIHGGAFRFGSGYHDGDGAALAPRGIVVVTINYRLGALGFSSTGDDVMPGNYGMLDQIMALKWVQTNIRAFGGDPTQVTIGGESAGAFSVSLQILSPLAKGLFIRAVMESGSSLSGGAVDRPGKRYKVVDYTKRVATDLGCNTATSADILQCLRNADVDRLMQVSKTVEDNSMGGNMVAIPRVETVFGFLPDYPENLLRDGNFSKVDTVAGCNSGEWCWSVYDPDNNGITKDEFKNAFQGMFGLGSYVNGEEMTRLAQETYVGNETDPFAVRASAVHALSDMMFGAASLTEIIETLRISNTGTRHFFFEFDHRANGASTPDWCGVVHAQERQFVFFDEDNAPWASAEDKSVADDVQTMWSNFVKFGDPTPSNVADDMKVTSGTGTGFITWSAYTQNSPMMMTIDVQSTVLEYPRPEVIPLYERFLELMMLDVPVESTPIIG